MRTSIIAPNLKQARVIWNRNAEGKKYVITKIRLSKNSSRNDPLKWFIVDAKKRK